MPVILQVWVLRSDYADINVSVFMDNMQSWETQTNKQKKKENQFCFKKESKKSFIQNRELRILSHKIKSF